MAISVIIFSVDDETHRDCSIHIERECLAVFTFAKLGCFLRQICFFIFSLLLKF